MRKLAVLVGVVLLAMAAAEAASLQRLARHQRAVPSKVTAEYCNGLPCSELGKPLPESPPPPRPQPQPSSPPPAAAEGTVDFVSATQMKPAVPPPPPPPPPPPSLAPLPLWCDQPEHQNHPDCRRTLPSRFDGGETGPTGRTLPPGLFPPVAAHGPTGRLPDPTVQAVWVKHLNGEGGSPLGRISNDKMKEMVDGMYHPWKKTIQQERVPGAGSAPPAEWVYLNDDNGYGLTGEVHGDPVGRIDGAEALRELAEARVQQEKQEVLTWRSDMKTGPEKEDLVPAARVQWMHWDTFQEFERRRRAGEANDDARRNDTGFVHSNDRDFENFAFKPGVKILPPLVDGPEFNLNNALNHPERLFNSLDSDRERAAQEAEQNGLGLPGASNLAEPSADMQVDNKTGKVIPQTVDALPGVSADVSESTGTDGAPEPVEGWESKYPVRAAMVGPERGVVQDMVDETKADEAREHTAPLDPRFSPPPPDPRLQVQELMRQQKAVPPAGQAMLSESDLRSQMAELAARQAKIQADVLATQTRIHDVAVQDVRERISQGYPGYGGLSDVAASMPADDTDGVSTAKTVAETSRIAHQLQVLNIRQTALQEQVVKTHHKLAVRLPEVTLRGIRERISNGYEDYN